MAPAKRKRAATSTQSSKKSQKTAKSQAKKHPYIKLDETFVGDHSGSIYIDDNGVAFDAALNQTNIGDNNNKFYFLQLIESGDGQEFFTHTRWGRVGERGQSKTTSGDLEAAKKDFAKKFKDKTGLDWEDRLEDPKGGKKYTYLEKNYDDEDDGGDDEENPEQEDLVKSKLPLPTQRLIELIFNENHFNAALEDIGYNKDKLPLGKLSKNTLKAGFKHLQELGSLIKHPSLAQNKYKMTQKEALEDLSNKYYSTIPHITGRVAPPTIDNNDKLRQEVAMLDTLTDMSVANTIMKAKDNSRDAESLALIDKRFNSLGLSEMTPLSHSSSEYKELSKYLVESSGSTHSIRYRLEDIFRIERTGEKERFASSKFATIKDSNKMLLWHGSRTSNFGGILSQGLRIAPPEAPMTGYAFGKGVYLADCSSKSANYCYSAMSGGTGLLLLCEAELSRPMYEIPTGDSDAENQARKKNCIATKGVGKTVPQKWKDASCVNKDLKGVVMPDGPVGPNLNGSTGYLLYNEYIAYDVSQLRLRYLFKVGM